MDPGWGGNNRLAGQRQFAAAAHRKAVEDCDGGFGRIFDSEKKFMSFASKFIDIRYLISLNFLDKVANIRSGHKGLAGSLKDNGFNSFILFSF